MKLHSSSRNAAGVLRTNNYCEQTTPREYSCDFFFQQAGRVGRRAAYAGRDYPHGAITFIDANCDRISPPTSTLRGAFTFDGCPARPPRKHAHASLASTIRGAPPLRMLPPSNTADHPTSFSPPMTLPPLLPPTASKPQRSSCPPLRQAARYLHSSRIGLLRADQTKAALCQSSLHGIIHRRGRPSISGSHL